MPRPLSEDLRVRLVEAVEAGGTIRAVGERFHCRLSACFRDQSDLVQRCIGSTVL